MSDLHRADQDGTRTLRLHRPESRNALSTSLLLELRDELRAVQDDPAVRVVVLVGEGEVFCGGADVKEFAPDAPARASLARVRLVTQVLRQLRELEQPTLAAVNGPAVGAGWGLALACDLCFCAADATFALPEVTKGLRLPAVLVNRLTEVVGPVRAADIVLGGGTYSSQDGLAAGWVTRVLATPSDLVEAAAQFSTSLASRPRRAVTAAKYPFRRVTPSQPTPPLEYAWTEE